jgi:hypothetical protein
VHVLSEIALCTNCARMHRFQQIRVSIVFARMAASFAFDLQPARVNEFETMRREFIEFYFLCWAVC